MTWLICILFVAGLLIWTGWTFRSIRREKDSEISFPVLSNRSTLAGDWVKIIGGLVLLVGGSQLLVHGATDLARLFGVSESLIGFTVVAAGTSLPELASSIVAARRGQADMALGNIIGSNLFNLLGILGTTAMVAPIPGDAVGLIEWIFFVGAAVLMLPLMRSHFTVHRWEGALLCCGFILYLVLLWQ
jgi:cation:H+ antiporter